MDLLDDDDDEPEAPRGSASASASGEVAEKKQRFVWTPDLHCRFEAAVHKLGVAHAKPQAIRRLMGCDGEENAPTRQNIKSHLQKYRLMMQKRARAVRHALPPHSSLRHALTPSPVIARRARGLTAFAHVAGG